MYKFKQKSLKVDHALYERVLNQLQPHIGRCSDKDVDKGLEEELCKTFFSIDGKAANVSSAPEDEDIKFDIDCYVNGHTVQVKCRKNDRLTLEDGKTRNGRRLPGWLDRSKAELFLYVWPNGPDMLAGRYLLGSDLKRLLHIYRAHSTGNPLTPDDLTFVSGFGGLGSYVYHKEVIDESTGDGKGSWFEVVV